MGRWMQWAGPLDLSDKLAALKEAYEIGVMEMPAEIYRQTGYQIAAFLEGLIPMLLQVLIALSATTALGGLIGAAVGAFFGGPAALPGAAIGAELGLDLGIAILTWLGLAFLIEAIGHGLIDLVSLLKLAVLRAWHAPDSPQPRQEIQLAGRDLARCGAMLMLLILQGIVAWITKKGMDKVPEMMVQLRKSRLTGGFVTWIEQNLDKLLKDPALRKHRGTGSAAKEVDSRAQTPSQLAKRAREDEAPPPKAEPKPKAKPVEEHKVPCFHPYDKRKFQRMNPADQKEYLKEMSDQLKKQQDAINSMSADQYKAARDAFKAAGERNPVAAGAQAAYRDDFAEAVKQSIANSLGKGNNLSAAKIDAMATQQTEQVMSKLAALHEPDMVAGGWLHPDPQGMGRTDVNSSIGGSWNQGERVLGMDKAADDAIKAGKGAEKMNVKLEPCRGKGMR